MSTGSVQVVSSNVSPTKGGKSSGATNQQDGKVSGFQLLLNQLGMKVPIQASDGTVSKSNPNNSLKKVIDGSDKPSDDTMANLLSMLQTLQQQLIAFTHRTTTVDGQQKSLSMQSLRDVLRSISTQLQDLKGKQLTSDSFKSNPVRLQDLQQYVDSIQNLVQELPEQVGINRQVNLVMQSIQNWMSLGQNSTKLFNGYGMNSLSNSVPKTLNNDMPNQGISTKNGSSIYPSQNVVDLLNHKNSIQNIEKSNSANSNQNQTLVPFTTLKAMGSQKTRDDNVTGSNQGNEQMQTSSSIPAFMVGSNTGQFHVGTQTDIKIPAESFAQQFSQLLDSKGLTAQNAMFQSTANGQEFRIKLIPEGMGEIHVLIQSKDAGLSVQFAASSEQARQMLDAQSGQLREQLNARGFELEQVQVTNLSNTPSFAFTQSDQQSHNWGNQQQKSKRGVSSIDEQDLGFGNYLSNPELLLNQNNPFESDQTSSIDTTA